MGNRLSPLLPPPPLSPLPENTALLSCEPPNVRSLLGANCHKYERGILCSLGAKPVRLGGDRTRQVQGTADRNFQEKQIQSFLGRGEGFFYFWRANYKS